MDLLSKLRAADAEVLLATPYRLVELQNEQSCAEAANWWTEMTSESREGMVLKPLNFIADGRRGVTEPAIKCRGPEYLRIIYGARVPVARGP
jgi:protein phosphatase